VKGGTYVTISKCNCGMSLLRHYSTCNFRGEAKAVDTVIDACLDGNRIVEFRSISSPEVITGGEETWGQLYVS
jgi:hypothetical protein